MEICRAGLGPPPAWRALPNIVSSICSGRSPARSRADLAATTPISRAVSDASDPPNLPIGVRTAERIKTSRTGHLKKGRQNPQSNGKLEICRWQGVWPVWLCDPGEFFASLAVESLFGRVGEDRFFRLLRLLQHEVEELLRLRRIPQQRKRLPVHRRRPKLRQRGDTTRSAVPLIRSEPIGRKDRIPL